jgi:hypothetical protein
VLVCCVLPVLAIPLRTRFIHLFSHSPVYGGAQRVFVVLQPVHDPGGFWLPSCHLALETLHGTRL